MTPSSKEAFIKLCLEGKAMTIKEYVYRILLERPEITTWDLEKLCAYKHETFSARLSELIYDGLVEVIGTKKSPRGSVSVLLAVKDKGRIEVLHKRKRKEKFLKYKKTMLSEFSEFIPDNLLTQLKMI